MNVFTVLSKFRKEKPYLRIGKYGIQYYINPNSALDRHIVMHGILGDWIATHLKDFVSPSGIVLDIGANAGLLTVPFAKVHVPEGRVIAFEPDEEVLKQLRINVALNGLSNVTVEPMALQDDPKISEISFNLREARDGDGLINKGISTIQSIDLHSKGSSPVAASTVDNYIKDNKINKVDFIKIDVEGAEFRVLKGALETIKRDQPVLLYEFSVVLDKLAGGSNSSQTFNLLADLGYVQYLIKDERSLELLEQADSVKGDINILCLPRMGKDFNLV